MTVLADHVDLCCQRFGSVTVPSRRWSVHRISVPGVTSRMETGSALAPVVCCGGEFVGAMFRSDLAPRSRMVRQFDVAPAIGSWHMSSGCRRWHWQQAVSDRCRKLSAAILVSVHAGSSCMSPPDAETEGVCSMEPMHGQMASKE